MNPPKPLKLHHVSGGAVIVEGKAWPTGDEPEVFLAEDVRLWARQLADKLKEEVKRNKKLEQDLRILDLHELFKVIEETRKELLLVAGDEKT